MELPPGLCGRKKGVSKKDVPRLRTNNKQRHGNGGRPIFFHRLTGLGGGGRESWSARKRGTGVRNTAQRRPDLTCGSLGPRKRIDEGLILLWTACLGGRGREGQGKNGSWDVWQEESGVNCGGRKNTWVDIVADRGGLQYEGVATLGKAEPIRQQTGGAPVQELT